MSEYRVKGLSCGNCAMGLEQQIKKLEYGESATLSYNSGKLKLDSRVSLTDVERILKSDNAYIDRNQENQSQQGHEHKDHDHKHNHSHDHQGHDHGDGHSHSHDHGSSNKLMKLLIVSFIIYGAAFIFDNQLNDAIQIGMYVIAIILSGYSTFIKGLKNLFALRFNIDTLMTIALVGAVSIGEWKEATLVAILFGLNELLEGLGMEKARRSMETLLKVAPKEATVLENGIESVVPISSLKVGDLVVVKPGEKIPSDGTVKEGKSSVNEAAITGESLPVEKSGGEPVFGGSINNEGILHILIEKAYKDSSLAKILHLVEEAQETKTPTELFINKFAKYYTPIIMAISALVILIPPLLLGGDWSKWVYQGLAVLIVGCPCALILSSPIAIVSGITRNARNGILIKGGVFLEQLGKIDTLAFDKTGTLTKGEPHVEKTIVFDEDRFLLIAGSIEKSSSHPLAKAIMKKINESNIDVPAPDEIQTVSGRGIVAFVQRTQYWLGNEKSMEHIEIPVDIQKQITDLKEQGLTLVILADNHNVLGMFGISDEIREESKSVVEALHRAGIKRTVMLTGDHQKTAEKVANIVGVTSYFGGLLPEDKVNKIKELAKNGHVAMIGDGINDAPALASAQLGIAMGKGTDSAIETADIVLMQDHLGKLPEAVTIAKKVNSVIRFNIIVALGLKLIALLLTIPGLLTLWIAILSDMGATIFVTLVSLTVLIQKKS
ncbi:heavy metal translocating P-type ATPase [Paenibacillus alginolyticus]|uniref:Cd(2+)-exporting ATPase n=1 Tax=Paenibacillus alginolyticus TaxID=59839 RepID=A0ABT4GJ04_9BACL|nr:heavy metal translocating P-type ATPase [Paenibacillus alginolyticus]MCY9696184.1 cadmium-translocating P-type ATPase [Paenibacillus alginolyticus]MEC0143337.1 heavy metal translocating P-type ATPase [Paenibacillus alginolyticus]